MFTAISNSIVSILVTLLMVCLVVIGLFVRQNNSLDDDLSTCNESLAVVANMSHEQEVKVVEAKQVEERIKVLTQDRIQIVKEYVYDENKTDCDNAIDSIRLTF